MKMNLIDEGCVPECKVGLGGLLCTSIMKLLFCMCSHFIDKTNNSNESESTTGSTFSFWSEFEGRLFI